MDYSFGTGDGTTCTWSSPADVDLDRDGTLDAVALDGDGDGRVDDALWDSDGDGVADRSVLDLDDDGVGDHGYADPAGLGTWAARAELPPVEPQPPVEPPPTPLTWTGTAGRRGTAAPRLDLDADGRPDSAAVDTDDDGRVDTTGVDTNLDGAIDTQVVDVNGDDHPDLVLRAGDAGYRW